MGKELFLNRYSSVIKRLEKSPANYAQIEAYLMKTIDFEFSDTATYSIRTLQRDIKDIERLFNIEILNERKGDKRYYIANKPENEPDAYNQVLLESHQIINAINKYPDFANYVFLEERKPKGLQHFYNLLHAIQHKNIITFEHFKFLKGEATFRRVFPYALKESQKRWYLIGLDTNDNKVKTFGLDRITNLEILKNCFKKKENINIQALFNNSYGIITIENEEPQKVVLKSTKLQADYIKSFPLHKSQVIINKDNNFTTFQITVHITYDFIQELLSYGKDVEIIAPLKLRNKVVEIINETLKNYQ